MKVAELNGVALDWAVAKAEGEALVDGCLFTKDPDDEQVLYSPSTDWAQGGPIIEREGIALGQTGDGWEATCDGAVYISGQTPLIAAMRCYVMNALNEEVEIPEEVTA